MDEGDDEFDEATLAEIAQFVRDAEARRLRDLPTDQGEPRDIDRPATANAPSGGDRLLRLGEVFQADGTALIRTDFSDDAAWRRVVGEVSKPVEFEGSPYGPYEPHVVAFDDRFFEGATGRSMADLCGAQEEVRGYVILADAQSMIEAAGDGDITVDYVDLSVVDEDDPELRVHSYLGRTFRCAVSEFASIEANLAIANMDFDEYASSVEEDGVFRGFAQDE